MSTGITVQPTLITNPAQLGFGGLTVADASNPYEPWLGPIQQSAFKAMEPYSSSKRTIRNLPEFYAGQNVVLLSYIEEERILDSSFFTTVILPAKESDEMNFEWNVWKFNRHLLRPVPYQGVSRFITSETNAGSTSVTRYGIAFTLEHGFMDTDAGRQNYFFNIRSIAGAVNDTAGLDCFTKILSASKEPEYYAKQEGYYKNSDFDKIMDMERDNFALIQKDVHGFQKMDTLVQERMRFFNAKADTWLVPPIIQFYLMTHHKNVDFYLAGSTGPERIANVNASLDNPNAFAVLGNGTKAFFVRQFNHDHHQSIDVTQRTRQIGEYNTLLPTASTDVKNYTKKDRNRVIYNEDTDNWHELTIEDVINNCMLFREKPDESGLSRLVDLTHTGDDKGIRVNPFAMPSNMDMGDNDSSSQHTKQYKSYQPIEVFGHMKEIDLSNDMFSDLAATILNTDTLKSLNLAPSIEQFMGRLNTIANKVWPSRADLETWVTNIKGGGVFNTGTDIVVVRPNSSRYEQFKAFESLKYNLSDGYSNSRAVANIINEIGSLNWYGLLELAQSAGHSDVGQFITNIKTLVHTLKGLFPGCALLDENRTPGHYPVPSSEAVFFESAFGICSFPVWINVDPGTLKGDVKDRTTTLGITVSASQATQLAAVVANDQRNLEQAFARIAAKLGLDATNINKYNLKTLQETVYVTDAPTLENSDASKSAFKNASVLFQQTYPFTPFNRGVPTLVSFESLQRYRTYASLFSSLDTKTLNNASRVEVANFLSPIKTLIDAELDAPDVDFNDPSAVKAAMSTSTSIDHIDKVLTEWMRDFATWFNWNSFLGDAAVDDISMAAELYTDQYINDIAVARAQDLAFYNKAIRPGLGILGHVSIGDVKAKTHDQIVAMLDKNATGDAKISKIGGRFGGEEDTDFDVTTFRKGGAPDGELDAERVARTGGVRWIRTTYSLSAHQVAELVRLCYRQGSGANQLMLVTVSSPSNPESPATPAELLDIADTYKNLATSHLDNVPTQKRMLVAHMLKPDQRLKSINMCPMYRKVLMTHLYQTAVSSAKRGRDPFDGGDGNLHRPKRRQLTKDGDTYELTGDDDGDAVGSFTSSHEPILNKLLMDSWKRVSNLFGSTLVRAINRAFIMTPFSRECLMSLYENNCIVPVGFLVFCPHMTYGSKLAIKIQAGNETGNYYMGNRSFELGNNPKTKVFIGHYTIQTAAVIHHPANIYVAYDIFIAECKGGAGVEFWNYHNRLRYRPSDNMTHDADRFAIMCSYNENKNESLPTKIDATGYFGYFDAPGLIDDKSAHSGHYSTHVWYNRIWPFKTPHTDRPSPLSIWHPLHQDRRFSRMRINTVMWRGGQAAYNSKSGRHDLLSVNTGHWGETGFGPGSKVVRNGGLAQFHSLEEIRASLCY